MRVHTHVYIYMCIHTERKIYIYIYIYMCVCLPCVRRHASVHSCTLIFKHSCTCRTAGRYVCIWWNVCMYAGICIYLPIYPCHIPLPVYLPISVYLCIFLSILLSIYQSFCVSIHLSTTLRMQSCLYARVQVSKMHTERHANPQTSIDVHNCILRTAFM